MTAPEGVSPWPNGCPVPEGLAAEPLAYIATVIAEGQLTYDEVLEVLTDLVRRAAA